MIYCSKNNLFQFTSSIILGLHMVPKCTSSDRWLYRCDGIAWHGGTQVALNCITIIGHVKGMCRRCVCSCICPYTHPHSLIYSTHVFRCRHKCVCMYLHKNFKLVEKCSIFIIFSLPSTSAKTTTQNN